jgi:hypothetical protein
MSGVGKRMNKTNDERVNICNENEVERRER